MTDEELVAELERAEEGSRELDGRIAWVLGWRFNGGVTPDDADFAMWPEIAGHWHKPGDCFADGLDKEEYRSQEHGFPSGRWEDPPHFTTNLQDTLDYVVSEGWWAQINARPDLPSVVLQEFPVPCRRIPSEAPYVLAAKSCALALCAAALRARSA